jgi:hypothetical protein
MLPYSSRTSAAVRLTTHARRVKWGCGAVIKKRCGMRDENRRQNSEDRSQEGVSTTPSLRHSTSSNQLASGRAMVTI